MTSRPYVAEPGLTPFTQAELAYLESERRRIAARVQINPVDNRLEVSDDWAARRREIKELDGYRM